MQKKTLICSLLTGSLLFASMVGCDSGKSATKTAPKSSGSGSNTGGGTEIPAAKGAAEAPKEEKAAEAKPTEEKPAEEKPAADTPKD